MFCYSRLNTKSSALSKNNALHSTANLRIDPLSATWISENGSTFQKSKHSPDTFHLELVSKTKSTKRGREKGIKSFHWLRSPYVFWLSNPSSWTLESTLGEPKSHLKFWRMETSFERKIPLKLIGSFFAAITTYFSTTKSLHAIKRDFFKCICTLFFFK